MRGGKIIFSNPDVSGYARIDEMSENLVSIDIAHNKIHEGKHFYIDGSLAIATSGSSLIFTVQTPNTTTWAHMSYSIGASKQTIIEVYEDSLGVSGGTSVTPINNNRNSVTTSVLTILQDPTVTTSGTLIRSSRFGVLGTNQFADQCGDVARDKENVLKQNCTYMYKITAEDTEDIIDFHGYWYEMVSKN